MAKKMLSAQIAAFAMLVMAATPLVAAAAMAQAQAASPAQSR